MRAEFFKYQALGNDMVVIDPARFHLPLTPDTIRLICHRHFGLGADGICYGPLPNGGNKPPHPMRFFNPDGSEAEKSGNGLRIFARYLWDLGYVSSNTFEILIGGQVIGAEIMDTQARTIALQMGRLFFNSANIPVSGPNREVVNEPMAFGDTSFSVTAVSIGNPHCVIFVEENAAQRARQLGPLIETAPQFPNRTNVQFVRVVDRHTIEIEIWERGAGHTLASGTSASATVGAAIKTGRCDSPVEVRMAGGTATVAIDDKWQVTLTGSVEAVCSGSFSPDFAAQFSKKPL